MPVYSLTEASSSQPPRFFVLVRPSTPVSGAPSPFEPFFWRGLTVTGRFLHGFENLCGPPSAPFSTTTPQTSACPTLPFLTKPPHTNFKPSNPHRTNFYTDLFPNSRLPLPMDVHFPRNIFLILSPPTLAQPLSYVSPITPYF